MAGGLERPTAGTLRQYLHEHIPLSAAMGVDVVEASDDGVRLRAPLEPNINHRSTAFGGSASALGILAGWTLVHVRLGHAATDRHRSRIVIQNSYVQYDEPIDGDFDAVARPPAPDAWDRFIRTIQRRGRGRIEIAVTLELDGRSVGRLTGTYVVLPSVTEPTAG